MLDPERLRRALRERLSEKRYRHSICVQRRAAQLAKLHGADWYRAAVAGLAHDICHCDGPDRQLKYLKAHGILLDDFYIDHPQIWHAVCGSVLLREEFGVCDPAVLQAVRYHTTGRAGMSTLEKVVYLADATGDDRDYPGAQALRALADRSLDAAMAKSLRHNIEMLVAQGKTIVRDAAEAYNHYCGFAWAE